MRIENRELYVSFWDEEYQCGVYSLLIGWNDDLHPVVAYNFGLRTITTGFEVATNLVDGRRNATDLRGPR